ncbi:MAG TPA: glycosyltransferase family 39 protein [Polyangiaceae bacterium]|nr:glycosyltransferase family 39 protein [Polyangiaceae bacterium]
MMADPAPPSRWARPDAFDAFIAAGVALAARAAVVAWASSRFPPAEDGRFYDVVARRIAHGLGYTWLWPDGAVTYAAHYPVGYPALLGGAYAIFGERPVVAMALNAVLGAGAAFAVHRVAATSATRTGAALAALAVALHPGLVAYTPALMTEGTTAALLAIAAWLVVRARDGTRRTRFATLAALAVALGAATLVRPQSLLLAPFYGFVALRGATSRRRVLAAAAVTAGAMLTCLPWTLRNCSRMHSCALVSVNAGWNLFIGAAPGATGSWVPIEKLGVPSECRTVWDEAAKDACFLRAGARAIRQAPLHWLSLAPKKLADTFDYAGAAGFYLHSSNPDAFGEASKIALGTVETIWQRLVVLAGLVALVRAAGPREQARRILGFASSGWLVVRSAWVAHIGVIGAAGLLGSRLVDRPAAAIAASTVFATALTHAAFFGAGRYSLVCFPALAALAGTALTRKEQVGDTHISKES